MGEEEGEAVVVVQRRRRRRQVGRIRRGRGRTVGRVLRIRRPRRRKEVREEGSNTIRWMAFSHLDGCKKQKDSAMNRTMGMCAQPLLSHFCTGFIA